MKGTVQWLVFHCSEQSPVVLSGPTPPTHTTHTAGFQTHTTPVLMNAGERAELGTEKYLPLSPILEGIVILKPNPDYVEVTE